MCPGGGAEGLVSSTKAEKNRHNQQNDDGFCNSVGNEGTCVVYSCHGVDHRKKKPKKFRQKTGVIFNADQMPMNELGTHDAYPSMDIASIQETEQRLKAAKEENSRLKAENESLIISLFVKSDILKAILAAKNLRAPINEQPAIEQKQQDDNNDEEERSYQKYWIEPNVLYPDQNSEAAVIAAAAAAGSKCTSMDSDEPAVAKLPTSPTMVKVTPHQRQFSHSLNRNPILDIDYSDVTSSMIGIRSHQGDLKLLLQEADEEGLSTDLMASIDSTVAETSKIYSELMSQRREHPALNTNSLMRDGEFSFKPCEVNHRSIAVAILERLSQQALVSLHGSWQAHSQKLELHQRKQSRLEAIRTSLAVALQKRDENAAGEGNCQQQNVSWKARACAFLASDYLAKTSSQVYWEEWDAIDKFEGTCCEILGSYNTAIMYVQSAPASPNCAAVAKEVLSLAQARGRLCLAPQ
ncbi:hypothetical protein NADE_000778 [Nannochloris sp. 'desiccata']|nr:hypothetical protein KSW81_003711 [Chlorella desiccata (nom. nud.)]KAH7615941.1 hypothetical protein NADE_000778 [Chlorella desiccata (nom. nud.)]